jgi:hypothetical protein
VRNLSDSRRRSHRSVGCGSCQSKSVAQAGTCSSASWRMSRPENYVNWSAATVAEAYSAAKYATLSTAAIGAKLSNNIIKSADSFNRFRLQRLIEVR